MRQKNKFLLGFAIIFLGLLLNKWVIERLGAPDGIIESQLYVLQILSVQLLLILFGTYLTTMNTVFKKAIWLVSVPFLSLSIVNITGTLNERPKSGSQETQDQSQSMLDRVISLDQSKLSNLSQQTSEILYFLHQSVVPLTFKIPEDGVLDSALGVEPLITSLFTGNVYFQLSIAANDLDSQVILRKDIELSSLPEEEFTWQEISVDLSGYSGREITLNLEKGYSLDSQNTLRTVYDLLPSDFMYWRTPSIRPKKINDKYNVILISLDTLRADHLHFMGYPRETTPNLDRLAENGVFFTTVVSQSPWTTPSHFSIFTSAYPSVHGANEPIQMLNRRSSVSLPTMATILREKGYLTAAFTGGGSISAEFGFYKGFDSYSEETWQHSECFSDAETIFQKSMQWLNDNKDRTFFLFIHTYEPHAPYCDEFFVKQEGINKSERIEHLTARYDGDIRRADFFVGKLMAKLGELGLTDNSIIVITSDHGEDLAGRNPPGAKIRRHGHNLYDELLLVPLMFHNPKIIPSGRRIDPQVRLIDILPTILEFLGDTEERGFQGKSLKGMIDGYDQISRPAYSEATSYGPERESIRANGYKYIHRISYGQLSEVQSRGMLLTPLHELYELNVDPDETTNLAGEEKDIVKEYQKLIGSILPETTFRDDAMNSISERIDINKNEELLERLKALGYIR